MSIIGEVKCARCDRKYSGVRSRCPYCGARRIGRGKYSEETDNSKGKMLIGVLIMAVLVVAAGVLLFTTPAPVYEPPEPPSSGGSLSSMFPGDDDTESLDGNNTVSPPDDDPIEDDPTETPPSTEVISVTIMYTNQVKTDFTAGVGERVPLRARIEPVSIDEDIIWTSSDSSVFQVVADNPQGTSAVVTGIGNGTATLTVTVGDKEATCTVRVR